MISDCTWWQDGDGHLNGTSQKVVQGKHPVWFDTVLPEIDTDLWSLTQCQNHTSHMSIQIWRCQSHVRCQALDSLMTVVWGSFKYMTSGSLSIFICDRWQFQDLDMWQVAVSGFRYVTGGSLFEMYDRWQSLDLDIWQVTVSDLDMWQVTVRGFRCHRLQSLDLDMWQLLCFTQYETVISCLIN